MLTGGWNQSTAHLSHTAGACVTDNPTAAGVNFWWLPISFRSGGKEAKPMRSEKQNDLEIDHVRTTVAEAMVTGGHDRKKRTQQDALRSLLDIYRHRSDLKKAFPEAKAGDYVRLVQWAAWVSANESSDPVFSILHGYEQWYLPEHNLHLFQDHNPALEDVKMLIHDGVPAFVKDIIDVAEGLHQCGTFGPEPLAALADHLLKRHIECSAETGSGASTLLFSHSSDLHLAFTIDSGGGSVDNVKISPLLRQDHVLWIEGPTQLTLPTYRFQEKLQAVLIDGPHAYPFPDLEYYYLYQHLETGALLVIDDIQIPTIHNLFEFLRKDAMFVLDEVVDTTAFFTRTDAPTFCPIGDGWWEQGYNKTPLAQV